MADSQVSAYRPGHGDNKRSYSGLIWLLVVVLVAAAFAGAVFWAGGPDSVMRTISATFAGFLPGGGASSGKPAAAPSAGSVAASAPASAEATGSDEASAPLSGLPLEAQQRMYIGQLDSQDEIKALIENRLRAIRVNGTVTSSDTSARVPVLVTYRNGQTASGAMLFSRYNSLWYFEGFEMSSPTGTEIPTTSATFDSDVVKVLTAQQATAENQALIGDGLIGGGYTKATVLGVTKGAGTATVHMQFSGGTEPETAGRVVVCIQKRDGSQPFWFVARFANR
jgi:hypothetical protein